MKLKAFLFFIFTILIGFLFIQCPAQGTSSGGGGSSNGSSSSSSSSYTALGLCDTTFNNGGIGADNWIFNSAVRSDEKIFIVGDFSFYNGIDILSKRILLLNTDGTIDSTFNNGGDGADNGVRSIIIQPDGMILIVGGFTTYNSIDVPDSIIRLNDDGSVDSKFNNGGTGANSDVYCMALQSDGKILTGGVFTTYNGINVPYFIARLNTDGSIDTTFNNGGFGANQAIYKIAIQTDGKILIAGDFTTYNNVNVPDRIIRLNTDGSVDSTFNNGGSGAGNCIRCIAVQSDGKILIGGDFTTYNSINVPDGIIRLNTDGTADATFNNGGCGTGLDFGVYNINVFQAGKIFIGGGFTYYNGDNVPDYIIRLK